MTNILHYIIYNIYSCIDLCGYSNATALTVNNIVKALHGIGMRKINDVLYIPDNKRDELEREYPNVEQRIEATVRFWLLTDPLASWRRIIQQLDFWDEHVNADQLRHYAEELPGMFYPIDYLRQGEIKLIIISIYPCFM